MSQSEGMTMPWSGRSGVLVVTMKWELSKYDWHRESETNRKKLYSRPHVWAPETLYCLSCTITLHIKFLIWLVFFLLLAAEKELKQKYSSFEDSSVPCKESAKRENHNFRKSPYFPRALRLLLHHKRLLFLSHKLHSWTDKESVSVALPKTLQLRLPKETISDTAMWCM